MKKNDDPCSICENYSAEKDFECEFNENCPVAVMKRRNEILISSVASLRRRLDKMKSEASWDDDIRRGQVQGMW